MVVSRFILHHLGNNLGFIAEKRKQVEVLSLGGGGPKPPEAGTEHLTCLLPLPHPSALQGVLQTPSLSLSLFLDLLRV